jgi:hypothetical protein
LHRTLSQEDSEEIGKGINAVLNERLNGYDNGFESINLLSGQIRIYYAVRVRESVGPQRWLAGPRRGFGPNADFKYEILFLFQIYFINYKAI